MALEVIEMRSFIWVARSGSCHLWKAQRAEGETAYILQVARYSSWPTWLCAFPAGSVHLIRDRIGNPVFILYADTDRAAREMLDAASQVRRNAKSQLRFYVGHGFVDR